MIMWKNLYENRQQCLNETSEEGIRSYVNSENTFCY